MEDEYTVQMPGFIRQQMKTEFTPAGPVQMRVALCDMGQRGAYFASAARMPISAPGASPDLVLDGAANGVLATQPGATLTNKQPITLNGHPGREMAFDMRIQGQAASARLRIYYAKDRLYQIMWLGPKSAMSPSEIDKFFSSFTLTGSNTPMSGAMNSARPAAPVQTSIAGLDLKIPARLYYGKDEEWARKSTGRTVQAARASGADAQVVVGDHFTSVPPAMAQAEDFFKQKMR
jgi:hypothetical protein